MLHELVGRWIGGWEDGLRKRYGLRHVPTVADLDWSEKVGKKRFLHVGCGPSRKQQTVPGFLGDDWLEIRLDADASVAPDIVASMTSMPMVPNGAVDAIFSSHNIEHLYPHEVPIALAEFYRVLKPEGFLLVTCPDLQSLCRLVVADKLEDPAYISPAGPIAPIDVLYGHRPQMAAGNLYMAHHCGFTLRTLVSAVKAAGFLGCQGMARDGFFDLWLMANKMDLPLDELKRLSADFLPAKG